MALTVGSLRALLSGMVDDSTPIVIENHGEFRAVQRGDVKVEDLSGMETDDGETLEGRALVISSWS